MRGRVLRILVAALMAAVPALVVPASAAAATGQVLFVVASPSAPTTGETAVRNRLVAAGNTVTVADDDTVTAAAAADKILVIIGQTANSNAAGVKSLASVAVPIWVAKPFLFDDFGLTGRVAGTDYGDKAGSQLTIATATHPMAAGRTGTLAIQSGGRLSWGRPAASATVVARAGTDASVFVIAPGATLATGAAAPACRLTFPLYGNAPATFTANGWALFDAAVSWGTANCTAGPPPPDDPPSASVTAPTAGAVVSGPVTVSAAASDDVGVASVSFAVDGTPLGSDDSAPYSVTWNSAATSPGDHSITATATDTAGQATTSATVLITVEATSTPTGVLFVVATPGALTAGETAVRNRLTGLGFTVAVADDDTVGTAQATGTAFVLISQSASSHLAGVKTLSGVAVPVWVAKPYLFDDFGLTGPVGGTDYGDKAGTQLTIVDPAHPLAAGQSGTVAVQTSGRLSFGRPVAAAVVAARAGTDASVFTLAPGALRANGTPAPACRLTFPLVGNGPAAFTSAGWAMFDAAARWAAANCRSSTPPPPDPEPGGIEHVVLVSVDGLNPEAIRQLGRTGAPAFYRMIDGGVSTLNARTVYEATQTLPNHTSMVTSRPVTVTGGHRVTFNEDNGSTVHATAGTYCASVFDVVHDAGGVTAFYSSKAKLDFLDRSWNEVNGAPDVTGTDDGRDKIDTYQRAAAATITAALQTALRTAPADFSMIHYAGPDGVGHASGYMSDAYVAEVARTDGYIGDILDTIAADPGLAAHTVVIVTTDHGGEGTSHANAALAVNYTIPFLAWGAGVPAGMDVYALNPDRADPGTSRPDYAVAVPPVRNAEAGNLAAELLGYGPIPGSPINSDQSLDLAS